MPLRAPAYLNVHKKTVMAYVWVPGVHADRVQYVRTFDTTTAVLLVLRDWLTARHHPRRDGRAPGSIA